MLGSGLVLGVSVRVSVRVRECQSHGQIQCVRVRVLESDLVFGSVCSGQCVRVSVFGSVC